MKAKRCALLLFALIATTVLLACLIGCGGSGEASSAESQSSAETSSQAARSPAGKERPPKRSPAEKARHGKEKARFVKQGNAICRRADAEQRRLASRYLKRGPVSYKWELVDPAVVPAMEKELQELRALTPPKGDEAKIRRILEEMEKGVKDADFDPIDLIYTWSDPFPVARHLAKRYGLTVCAFSSETLIRPREDETGI